MNDTGWHRHRNWTSYNTLYISKIIPIYVNSPFSRKMWIDHFNQLFLVILRVFQWVFLLACSRGCSEAKFICTEDYSGFFSIYSICYRVMQRELLRTEGENCKNIFAEPYTYSCVMKLPLENAFRSLCWTTCTVDCCEPLSKINFP